MCSHYAANMLHVNVVLRHMFLHASHHYSFDSWAAMAPDCCYLITCQRMPHMSGNPGILTSSARGGRGDWATGLHGVAEELQEDWDRSVCPLRRGSWSDCTTPLAPSWASCWTSQPGAQRRTSPSTVLLFWWVPGSYRSKPIRLQANKPI